MVQLPGQQAVRVVLGTQQVPLPQRVVGVLHRQLVPLRGVAQHAGGVGGGKVAHERSERPAVADDVVEHQQQDVVLLARREQVGGSRRLCGQIEGVVRGRADRLLDLGLGHLAVDQFRRDPAGRRHRLHRPAVPVGEERPQALVPVRDIGPRLSERLPVQRAGQAQSDREVVAGACFLPLVEEPEPLLGVGQRQDVRARSRAEHRPAGEHVAEAVRQPGHGRCAEQQTGGQFHAQHGACPAAQPHGQQGVAAEIEEAVVDAHRVTAEHCREQPAQKLLAEVAGCAPGLGRVDRCGQRGAVEFSVRGERQFVDHHDRGGHHVVRQVLPGELAQSSRVECGVPGEHVSDEPAVARPVLAQDRHRVRDALVAGQCRLDLAELDTETPDLHLVVGPAEELQRAFVGPPDQVARAVHALSRPERVRDEPFRGQGGTVHVAPGQLGSRDVQFTDHLRGDETQVLVEDEDVHPGDRAADKGPVALLRRPEEGVHRGLRLSVDVVDGDPLGLPDPCPQLLPHRFRTGHQHRGRRSGRVEHALLDQLLGVAGHHVESVDAATLHVPGHGGGVTAGVVADQVEFVAGRLPQQTDDRGVEGEDAVSAIRQRRGPRVRSAVAMTSSR